MKKILFPLVLLICSIRLFSQDGGYDSFEHPMLKKLLGKAPAIIGFSEKEADKWISIAVLDSNTRILYLFTQTGLLHSELDVPDSVSNKLQARELSPFEFYKSVIQTDLALFDFAITKLRFPAIEYSIPGVNDFDKEIRDIIKEAGGKTKREKLRVLLQKRKVTQYDLATINLKLTGDVPTDSTFKDLLYRKNQILQNGYYISAGTVKKEFYALNSLSTLFKAVLHEERKCLVFYEKDDSPYDSMRLNAQQLQQISNNKINVFSLYQDYVMRQLERVDSVVWSLYVAARRSGKNEPFSAMAAYQPGAGNKKARAYQQQQQLLTRLHLTASSSSYRIRQYISYLQNTALVYKVGKYDENSETLFIFITTRVRRGRKQYELTDHRGNVMATINDKKVAVDTNGDGKVDHYAPDVVSATDYAPFGMALPGRNYSNEKYRYGFNGKEMDNEVSGNGNKLDFGARIYDSRLGRWLSIDPKAKDFPSEGPYTFVGNSPIVMTDPDGKFKIPVHKSITEYALGKLSGRLSRAAKLAIYYGNTVLADIFGANTDWHFDGRNNFDQIQAVWKGLNEGVKDLSKDFGWGNRHFGGQDAVKLGAMLHTVQDFYAHSNYIELYIQYYQDTHNGDLPVLSNIPLYEDALNDASFTKGYLKPNLKTGEFDLVDYARGKDKEKTNKRGETHHDEIAKDNRKMGKDIKSKDGKKSINTHDAAVDAAKRESEKVVKEVVKEE